jgi:hypothetical protein
LRKRLNVGWLELFAAAGKAVIQIRKTRQKTGVVGQRWLRSALIQGRLILAFSAISG